MTQAREGETDTQAIVRRDFEKRLLSLAQDAESQGVILELHRVQREDRPLAQGNHRPQVIAYTNHRL